MATFKKGDRVNFTLEVKGLVASVNPDGTLEIDPMGSVDLYNDDDYLKIDSIDPAICTMAAPVAWPPQEGDVWEDVDGEAWYAIPAHGQDFVLARSWRGERTYVKGDNGQYDGFKALRPVLRYRKG